MIYLPVFEMLTKFSAMSFPSQPRHVSRFVAAAPCVAVWGDPLWALAPPPPKAMALCSSVVGCLRPRPLGRSCFVRTRFSPENSEDGKPGFLDHIYVMCFLNENKSYWTYSWEINNDLNWTSFISHPSY